jgi:hypothetical protein
MSLKALERLSKKTNGGLGLVGLGERNPGIDIGT